MPSPAQRSPMHTSPSFLENLINGGKRGKTAVSFFWLKRVRPVALALLTFIVLGSKGHTRINNEKKKSTTVERVGEVRNRSILQLSRRERTVRLLVVFGWLKRSLVVRVWQVNSYINFFILLLLPSPRVSQRLFPPLSFQQPFWWVCFFSSSTRD